MWHQVSKYLYVYYVVIIFVKIHALQKTEAIIYNIKIFFFVVSPTANMLIL